MSDDEMYDPCEPDKFKPFNAKVLYGTIALLLVIVTLLGACTSKRVESAGAPLVIQPVEASDTMTDVDQTAKAPAQQKRRGIPLKPEPFQKTPPCNEDAGEEAVNGACYAAMKRKPPCGPILLEHEGTCYRAVAKAPKPPTSIER